MHCNDDEHKFIIVVVKRKIKDIINTLQLGASSILLGFKSSSYSVATIIFQPITRTHRRTYTTTEKFIIRARLYNKNTTVHLVNSVD